MIWAALGKAATIAGKGIYWTLGLLQGAGAVVSAGKKLVKAVRQGKLPHKGPNDTDPIPLHEQRRLRPTGKQRR